MDNNDSHLKPQQTGGLKLMTVFIAVLALHVVVIGGFTAYHLMSGGSTDADLTTTDKNHKGLKGADGPAVADGAMPDASQGDKHAPDAQAPTPATAVATIPANPPAPAPDPAAPTIVTAPVPAPAPTPAAAPLLITPKPLMLAPSTEVADQGSQTPTGPISSELAPPAEPAPAPLAPMVSGPVHMPAIVAPAPVSEHVYVVKITDSYKKIAQAHHLTVAQLKEANHIKSDVLHTGQKLVIPSAKTLVAATISTTALDASPTGPLRNESAPTLTAASMASAPSTMAGTVSQHHLYTVVKGDTLIKIAHKFKTTATAIMTENSITDPSRLTIGKKLKIPSQESRSARNNAPASTQPGPAQAKEDAPTGQWANFVP
jgi:LysM repeat protein